MVNLQINKQITIQVTVVIQVLLVLLLHILLDILPDTSRYYSIVDSYYDIKKKELELELLDEEIDNEHHPIKKKLKLEKEKNTIQLQSVKSRLDTVMKEINIYYNHYNQYNGKYNNLSDEDKCTLEEEMWEKKAINNPVIFEERYGNFIKDVLGEDKYKAYKERRKISVGLFPRELI